MRYWIVFVVYIVFVVSYLSYAQGCNNNPDKPVVTGAACSIKDLPKLDSDIEIDSSKSTKVQKDNIQKKKILKDKKIKNKD